jgi:hypothetical protein
MSMADGLDQVVALAREVAELRERIAQLDSERAAIEGQIAERMNRIAVAAVAAVSPAGSRAAGQPPADPSKEPVLSAAILMVIRRSPETVFGAVEIARVIKRTDRRSYSAIRTHLSRMAKDGRVTKLAFGKYKAR